MASKGSSKAQKLRYQAYQTSGTVFGNKVKKLKRHIKRFPNDKTAQINLNRIEEKGYKGRNNPLIPGSNQCDPKPVFTGTPGYYKVKTPAMQLSELLGIPLPKPRTKFKTKITHKPRRK